MAKQYLGNSCNYLDKFGLTITVLLIVLGLLTACSPTLPTKAGSTKDYMVVVNRPNLLHLIDLSRDEIVKSCQLPGTSAPGTLVMSPDNRIAYVLADHFSNVYGINIENCEVVFSAIQSYANIRIKSLASIAISPDGKELYTHQNPTRLLSDHFEVMDTQVAVYNTTDGLNAQPARTLPAPRQVTIMATDQQGTLYLGAPDIYAMNPVTGETRVVIPSRSYKDNRFSQRDSLTVWPIGSVSKEFIRMYSTAKYRDDSQDMDSADWMWGYERIDLTNGEIEAREFGPLNVVLFTGMTRPGDKNQMYAVLTQLKKYDVAKQQEIMSVDLEHTYYCINFSTDGSKIYLAGTFNDIAIYDADTLKKLGNIQLPGGDMSMSTPQIFAQEI